MLYIDSVSVWTKESLQWYNAESEFLKVRVSFLTFLMEHILQNAVWQLSQSISKLFGSGHVRAIADQRLARSADRIGNVSLCWYGTCTLNVIFLKMDWQCNVLREKNVVWKENKWQIFARFGNIHKQEEQ